MSFISLEFVLLLLLCFTLYHFVSEKGGSGFCLRPVGFSSATSISYFLSRHWS